MNVNVWVKIGLWYVSVQSWEWEFEGTKKAKGSWKPIKYLIKKRKIKKKTTWSLDFGKVELKRTGIASKNPRRTLFLMCDVCMDENLFISTKSYKQPNIWYWFKSTASILLISPNLVLSADNTGYSSWKLTAHHTHGDRTENVFSRAEHSLNSNKENVALLLLM